MTDSFLKKGQGWRREIAQGSRKREVSQDPTGQFQVQESGGSGRIKNKLVAVARRKKTG